MKQLILLAGLHKTATTSIQQTCVANQETIARAGLPYPVAPSADGSVKGNHTEIFNWFRKDPSRAGLMGQFKWTHQNFDGRDGELTTLAKIFARMPPRILMAAEGVSLFSLEELTQMRDWFARNGWELRVICHVRHVTGWMNSMIAQRASSGISLSIPQSIEEYRQYGSIVRRRIENILTVFPDARFHSHEKAVRHPTGPVGYFLQSLGVSLAAPIKFIRANEGSSDRATRVLSLVYQRFGRFKADGSTNHQFYDNLRFVDAAKALGGRKFTLRSSEAAPLMTLLQADNEWLRHTLGEDFHDPHPAFDDRPCEWTPESVTQLASIIAKVPSPVGDWLAANIERLDIDPAALAVSASPRP